MRELKDVAPSFVEMAHGIVWCTAATVDRAGRPRTRVVHPLWQWDGDELVGWVCTEPGSPKWVHLTRTPYASCTYWAANHDTCTAECRAEVVLDDEVRTAVWQLYGSLPEPLGSDLGSIGVPGWTAPTAPGFGVLRLRPWRLRVLPGEVLASQGGPGALVWQE